jgi:hypothetical protein
VRTPKPVLTNLDTGATIAGTKATRAPFVGDRLEDCFVDEAPLIPHLRDVMTTLDEVGPAIYGGTPRGMAGHWPALIHGRTDEAILKPGECRGRYGTVHLRYHWTLHPDRDAEWAERMRASRTTEAWAQEYDIDYTASAPGRIWRDFREELHVYTAEEWAQLVSEGWLVGATIIESWDFGTGPSLTACLRAAYVEATDTLYLLDYRHWKEAHADDVIDDVGAAGWHAPKCRHGKEHAHDDCPGGQRGAKAHVRIGDVAGKARDSTQRSWFTNMKRRGVVLSARSASHGRGAWAISAVAKAIRDGRLYCAPAFGAHHGNGLPTGVEVLQQYRYRLSPNGEQIGDPEVLKNDHSHLADAIQYAALEVWPMDAARLIPSE